MQQILTYFFLVVYSVTILGIILVIITENRNPLKTLPWIVVLVLAPVVGLVFYFFFGQNLSKQRIISRRTRKRITMQLEEPEHPEGPGIPPRYRPLASLLLNTLHSVPLYGSRIAVYTDGRSKMEALMEEIARARHHIHIQYYILNDDQTGCLEVEDKTDSRLLGILKKEFDIKEEDIFYINGPLDLTMLMKVYGQDGFDQYKEPKYTPAVVPAFADTSKDIFQVIREGDVFLHHPYMSFDPVVNFVRQAAKDPDVLAIKQTLYRVSGNSPIIAALAQAAENGKQVSVLVELKARFDEEHNIVWAKMLEKAGCHVIYGLVGLKTHSKITLVVRREDTGIRRYVHLATGNYNDSTAKLYTDCGIFTCDERFGEDATAVFNMLSGYSEPKNWNRLIVAPIWMKDRFLKLIEREAEHAKKGMPAMIVAKMNSLCDPKIIAALYHASSCGVQIYLLIRGICCLRVGIPGVSENIHVRSIVGNFLEHSRIFYFHNNGSDEIYMGSADWMPRNLDRRVEIVFPVEDEQIKNEIKHVLDLEFRDNVKAHILQPDGTYEKQDKRGKLLINSQMEFCREATEKAEALKKKEKHENSRVFIPAEPAEDVEE